ncbi:MAG: glycosyltransferase family 9 protein [Planctomycetota bacterium]
MAGEGPQRILGLHTGALGDVILFAHLLDRLGRTLDGRAIVTLVAGGEKARLLATLGGVDASIAVELLSLETVFAEGPSPVLSQRLGHHDRLVSCFASSQPPARRRLADACGVARADFLPIRPPAEGQRHLLDVWSDDLSLHGSPIVRPWHVPPALREAGDACLRRGRVDPHKPYVAVHPGSGGTAKCWPLERYGALAGHLDVPVVFVIGPIERERWSEEVLARLAAVAPVVEPTLDELAGLLAGARGFVGNDSGPAHLAAAIGTLTVALFGPTDPCHFAPRACRDGAVTVLHAGGWELLTVEAVAAAVGSVLKR